MKIIIGLVGILVTVAIVGLLWGTVFGIHLNVGSGDHTGYITAVERTGIFFKTGTAYLKTSTQSTQEDAYCVIDPQVFDELKAASVSGAHVNVHFFSWAATAVWECNGREDAIIDSVSLL